MESMDFNTYLRNSQKEHALQIAEEYSKGKAALAAGHSGLALIHARNGLKISEQNGSDPVEIFFMQELFSLIHVTDDDRDSARRAAKLMKPAFDRMSPENQTWTKPVWDDLSARLLS